MQLATYMKSKRLRPEEMASQIGDVSASGVTKWMREERMPRPDQQRRIFEVTKGAVTPNDFILPQTERAAS